MATKKILKPLVLVWKYTNKFRLKYPKISLVIKFIPVYFFIWLVSWKRLDPDFGWHLTSGNYFRNFGIPSHDIYSYTARNFPWIDHEWLNDVVLSFIYQWGGYLLTSLVYSAVWTLGFFLAAKKLAWPLLLAATVAILPYTGIRPIAWTFLGIAILMRMVASKSRRVKFFIPLLFEIWANLHAGFITGLIYLLYLAVKQRRKVWLVLFVISGLVTFINPYGPRLYVEIARTLTDTQLHSQIKEWARFYIPLISMPIILLWISGFWIYTQKKLKSLISFTLFLLASALSASRNLPLFVVAALPELTSFYKRTRERLPRRLDKMRRLLIAIPTLALWVFIGVVLGQTLSGSWNREASYPVHAVNYLSVHKCPGNLFNYYNYGGYLIWKLPSESVYIDGRMASWKDQNGTKYLDRYFNILNNPLDRISEFKQYDIRCALVGASNDTHNFTVSLISSGWKVVINDNGSLLLIDPNSSN